MVVNALQTHMFFWGASRIHFRTISFLIYIDNLAQLPTSFGSHSVLYVDDLFLIRVYLFATG